LRIKTIITRHTFLGGIRHLAAFFEFDEFVSDLVDAGCDVRARNLAGYFPIDLARNEDTEKLEKYFCQ